MRETPILHALWVGKIQSFCVFFLYSHNTTTLTTFLIPIFFHNKQLFVTPTICPTVQFSSVAETCPTPVFATSWITACQVSLSITNSRSSLNSHPSSQRCHPAISSSTIPFSSCPQALPASESFPMSQFFHQVAKVLEFQLQHQSFQWTTRTDLLLDGLVGSPCSPRDSQESSPTPQFKSINPSVLSFPYSPTLTSIHDHWKNHSLD